MARNLLCIEPGTETNVIPGYNTPGKHRLNVPLEAFSGRIAGNIDPSIRGLVGCEAIPRIDAYIELFNIDFSQNKYNSKAIRAWQGIHSMIALSRMIGFNLTEQTVSLDGINTVVTNAYAEALAPCLNGNNISLLKKDDKAIAFFHNRLGWVPMANMPEEVLGDVPWYDGNAKEWKNIWDCVSDARMQNIYYNKLLGWVNNLINSGFADIIVQSYLNHMASSIGAINGVVSNIGPVGNAFVHNTVYNAANNLRDVINNVSKLEVDPIADKDLFADTLLITGADEIGRLPHTISTSFSQNGENYSVLIPMSAKGTSYVIKNKDKVTLESVNVNTLPFSVTGEIEITIVLNICGVTKVYCKSYDSNSIIYRAQGFPQMSLWPDAIFDYNGTGNNIWKKYYVTFSEGLGDDARYTPFDSLQDDAKGEFTLDMDNGLATLSKITTYDNSKSWNTAVFAEYPRFLHMKYTLNGRDYDIGCVYIDPPADVHAINDSIGAIEAMATIDIGTTNSICAMKVGGNPLNNYELFDPKDTLPLQRVMNGDSNRGANDVFHSYYWISTNKSALTADDDKSKIRSIAQLYNTANPDPFLSGRAILTDGGIISYFDNKHVDANNPASPKVPLSAQGIIGNMKFASPAVVEGRAAQLFIEDLTLKCALLALKNNGSRFKVVYSYPDETSKAYQKIYWENAKQKVTSVVGINGFHTGYTVMTESEAAARYVTNAGNLLMPTFGYAVADIGGGTSDISLWKQDNDQVTSMFGSYSLHYAGNAILSNSIFNVLRKFPTGANSIWKADGFGMNNVFNTLVDSNSTLASYVQTNVQNMTSTQYNAFLNDLSTAVNGVLGVAPFQDFNIDAIMLSPWCPEKMLISLVRAKVAGVFYIISGMMNHLLKTTDAAGNIVDNTPKFNGTTAYGISLAGGGSRAIDLCGQPFVSSIIEGKLFTDELIETQTDPSVAINISVAPPLNSNKIEVVRGMIDNNGSVFNIPADTTVKGMPANMNQTQLYNEVKAIYDYFVDHYLGAYDESSPLNTKWFPYENGDLKTALQNYSGNVIGVITRVVNDMTNSGEINDCPSVLLRYVAALKTLELMITLYL